jgi:hypothetical protein
MKPEPCASLFLQAAKEFNDHTRRTDGERVAGSLTSGLSLLQDSLYLRLNEDLERIIGRDSMLVPVSQLKTRQATKTEITIYEIAESREVAERLGCVGPGDRWYVLWLARLRLGESEVDAKAIDELTRYVSMTPHERQLAFTNVLAKVLPESRRAPLILFELLPLAIQIVAAAALGDHVGALELRRQQRVHQPAIADCHSCRGQVLENGEQCQECGNPLWKHEWLIAE